MRDSQNGVTQDLGCLDFNMAPGAIVSLQIADTSMQNLTHEAADRRKCLMTARLTGLLCARLLFYRCPSRCLRIEMYLDRALYSAGQGVEIAFRIFLASDPIRRHLYPAGLKSWTSCRSHWHSPLVLWPGTSCLGNRWQSHMERNHC